MTKRARLCVEEEDGLGPQNLGRQRYLAQDYIGALEAFTEAIHLSTGHMLTRALDSRAATFEKLGDLQHALRDGKKMIATMPHVSEGYLRTGKVLCLKGEKYVALKIYERGLSKVSIGSSPNRNLLQSMYYKLQQELGIKKNTDPLLCFPTEIVQMICERLSMRDRVICLAVSKGWKIFLESIPSLWTLLDTTIAHKPIQMSALGAYLRRSNFTLARAIITPKSSIDKGKTNYLLQSCKFLKDLEIYGSYNIEQRLINSLHSAKNLERLYVSRTTHVPLSAVLNSLILCKNTLVEASFLNILGSSTGFLATVWPRLDALRTIDLRIFLGKVSIDMESLIFNTPNATRVTLNGCILEPQDLSDLTLWPNLDLLDVENTQLIRLPKLPQTLKHLTLDNNMFLLFNFDGQDRDINLPMLESFSCQKTSINVRGLLEITRASIKAEKLKRLFIGDRLYSFTTHFPTYEQFPASNTVEELSLAYLRLTDEHVLEIINLYPSLKKIDLSGTDITGVAVKALVLKGVEQIRINECFHICDDAVTMARSYGVSVGFKFPDR